MTRYGWDLSDYDWPRGPLDMALAHKQGIDLVTHKISEGTGFTSAHAGTVLSRAALAGVPVLGGYHVLMPADMASISAQVSHYLASLTTLYPGWRKHPCFVHQIDAEKFNYMTRKPTLAEIHEFGDGVVKAAGCLPSQVLAYAPHWLYSEELHGLRFHLWASAYVSGPGPFKGIYPGDNDFRWAAYSGITPTALQYASNATIAGQHPSDANAIRVATTADLVALFKPAKPATEEFVMDHEAKTKFDEIEAKIDTLAEKVDGLFSHGNDGDPDQLASIVRQELRAVGLTAKGNH